MASLVAGGSFFYGGGMGWFRKRVKNIFLLSISNSNILY